MRPHSSSISSSDRRAGARRRAVLATIGWTVAALVAIDLAVNLIFHLPSDPRVRGSNLAQYFDYGRSVEGKLRYLLGRDPAEAAPIVDSGWLASECVKPIAPAPAGTTGITFYGMSFSQHVAKQLGLLDPHFAPVDRSGPGASPNHSYPCFRMMEARRLDPNPVVVFGILSTALNRLPTLTGLTTTFEAPMPFTFPRYTLTKAGGLKEEAPLITAPNQYRDPARLAAFVDQLSRNDAFYDHWQFGAGPADHSAFLRLLRRAYAQRVQRQREERLIADAHGFRRERNVGPLLLAILTDFANRARARGARPIVLLIQAKSPGDALYRLLGPGLAARHIDFVSTQDIVATTDPANFLADGHFTPAADRRIAERLRHLLSEPE